MTRKPTGRPVVRQQRDRWVVRVDGIDTSSGNSRLRQLGMFRPPTGCVTLPIWGRCVRLPIFSATAPTC